ncbi:unnamed protein product [Periconia digitata]|uniref:Protein kinase domain-containing protein n=1 Tax=Periconia digitata TaxID=1303443 RepID=A0A9W4XKL1_9PLEO|nr:unnamed protein product [Periconia digitata]
MSYNPSIRLTSGEHVEIVDRTHLPFHRIGRLGMGASAQVEVVEEPTTRRRYAHKIFTPYYGHTLERFKKEVQNEIAIIKRLRGHPHIVNVEWSYACGRELGILLTPVASDGDLSAYLYEIRVPQDGGSNGNGGVSSATREQRAVLVKAFGCLASGLAFMHGLKIRHKDIKPSNILVHNGHMVYTDFGIAKDLVGMNTMTSGKPGGFTDRYCPPEVAEWDPRNRKSDVFSLGCVFIEIMAVLFSDARELAEDRTPYRKRLQDVQGTLIQCSVADFDLRQLFVVILGMVEEMSEDRVGATDLVDCLMDLKMPCAESLFCRQCGGT